MGRVGREIFTFRVFYAAAKAGWTHTPRKPQNLSGQSLSILLRKTVRPLKVLHWGLHCFAALHKRELSLNVLGEDQAILPRIFQQELAELLLRNRRFQIIFAP